MAKTFDPARDSINQIAVVNEAIVVGGSLFSSSAGEPNIKKFGTHWISGSKSGSFYHAVYSTNYSASTSTELVDVTFGYSSQSVFYTATSGTNRVEKNRIYKLFAKQLLGSEASIFNIDSVDRHELIFVTLKRTQFKDEIKKGTVGLEMIFSGTSLSGANPNPHNTSISTDLDAISTFTQGARGDYALLKTGSLAAGQVWYQAGMMALIPHRVSNTSSRGTNGGNYWSGGLDYDNLVLSGGQGVVQGTYENLLDAVRNRFRSVSFINQSNLHSTYYFVRALNDEFNYSSNPTFVDASGRIITTSGSSTLTTRTYITKVGLLGENSEVLAVASLSEPIKKTPENEVTIRVRLDF